MAHEQDERVDEVRHTTSVGDRRAVLALVGRVRWVGELDRSRRGRGRGER